MNVFSKIKGWFSNLGLNSKIKYKLVPFIQEKEKQLSLGDYISEEISEDIICISKKINGNTKLENYLKDFQNVILSIEKHNKTISSLEANARQFDFNKILNNPADIDYN